MKKKPSILKICAFWITVYSLVGCAAATQSPPTIEPTQIPTSTYTPEPTPTQTPLPTFTPSPVPTLVFYSVNPTIVATSASCSAFPRTVCVPGLLISLSGRKLEKYDVAISYPGFSGTSFECPQQALIINFGNNMAPVICNSSFINFVSVGLTEITITITWDGGSVFETLHPVFEIEAPEGPNCSPQCLVGKAEIEIP